MATIDGTFPDARGHPQTRTGMLVEVTKSGAEQYQLTVDTVGHGTITMKGGTGTGLFRLMNDDLLEFAATRVPGGIHFRLSQHGKPVAQGVIRDLPP